jgi:hypothetical protein
MDARDPRRIAASLAMFERLAEHWSLRHDERDILLGGVPKSTWSEWRQRPNVARIKSDTRERIANLFAIDLNAHALFAPEFADRWVREPNAAFNSASPLATMLRGKVEDVITVRRYLERIASSSPADTRRSTDAPQVENQAFSALLGDAVESAENSEPQWQTEIGVQAAKALIRTGVSDASLTGALYATILQIERQPFGYPANPKRGNVRVARLEHQGVTWLLRFIVSVGRRIVIASIEREGTS